jgi:hypothetical protein
MSTNVLTTFLFTLFPPREVRPIWTFTSTVHGSCSDEARLRKHCPGALHHGSWLLKGFQPLEECQTI